MTFMYECRSRAETAKSSTELLWLFVRHIVEQSAEIRVEDELRERCKPLVEEARQRGFPYFRVYYRISPSCSVVVVFKNTADKRYSRSIGIERMWRKYGIDPNCSESMFAVEGFLYGQADANSRLSP